MYPIIRKLLKDSNYTLMVLPTADTWYDGWKKNVFLIYTNSEKGNCSVISETTDGKTEWECE